MAGSDVGRLDEDPLDVVAELVEVADHLVKSEAEVSSDVLEYGEGGAKNGQCVADVGPEVPLVLLPQALAGLTERLARIPAGDDVHRLDGRPVDRRDVAQVRGVRESVGEHLACAGVDLGHPCGAGVEHLLDGPVEHSSTREQAADGERHSPLTSRMSRMSRFQPQELGSQTWSDRARMASIRASWSSRSGSTASLAVLAVLRAVRTRFSQRVQVIVPSTSAKSSTKPLQ